MRSRSASGRGRKRERSPESRSADGMVTPSKKQRLSISLSRSRSVSRPPHEVVPGEGFKDSAQKVEAIKPAKKSVKKRNKDARRGEADRR
ncbi:hypothetical protein Fmac_027726 [Flemingia macrophylla]|uniref:Uncharacterized protein n=1 Tax=Flemingia macrophylla TaxID=520843 RepID=A0ABD1LIJ4_9FABA